MCYELEPWKGYCVKTIDQSGQYVDDTHLLYGKTWWELRPTLLMIPPDDYAEMKKYILKNCKRAGKCDEVDKFLNQMR